MIDQPHIPRWVVSRKARIRKGLKVEILIGSEGFMAAEWDPGPPTNLT